MILMRGRLQDIMIPDLREFPKFSNPVSIEETIKKS